MEFDHERNLNNMRNFMLMTLPIVVVLLYKEPTIIHDSVGSLLSIIIVNILGFYIAL